MDSQSQGFNSANFQENLDENMELKRAVAKLEDLYGKERKEKEEIQRIYENFKVINEKVRKECNDLNQKLIFSYQTKSQVEEKYEGEIEKLKHYYERQREAYEDKILKLSSTDSEVLRQKLTTEIELQYRGQLEQKTLEIDNFNDLLFESKKKNEFLSTEFDSFKREALQEIDRLKERHKSEVRELMFEIQLLNDKYDTSKERESYKSIKAELESYRKQFSDMHTEISNIRREKEQILLEKNETKLSLVKELDQEKFNLKKVTSEQEKLSNQIKSLESENQKIKVRLEERNEEIKDLTKEKYDLIRELREKDLDFQSFNVEIHSLRRKMEERDKEIHDNLYTANEREKQRFIEFKNEKEELQRRIEEMTVQHRDLQVEFKNFSEKADKELHSAQRDYYIVKEEKKMLKDRMIELQRDLEYIREDYDRKSKHIEVLEAEHNTLQEKYQALSNKEAENYRAKVVVENALRQKTEEMDIQIRNFTENINMLKKTSGYEELRDVYEKKFNQLLMRKDYYKNKVKEHVKNNLAIMLTRSKRDQPDNNRGVMSIEAGNDSS